MVNKNLIDKIISILMIFDLFFGVYFLAVLAIYTSLFDATIDFSNPLIYIVAIVIILIPISVIIYYIYSLKEQKNDEFIFNRDSYLKIKELNKKKKNEEENIRFSKLMEIDKQKFDITYDKVTDLKEFSEEFRNFCASELGLFYSDNDIRAFIANLLTSKLMILQGMSGTGKTSIALAFEKYVGNLIEPIAIQPMWKERSDLVGYFNEFTKKFNETLLLEELYESNFNDKIYVIILDEVNIARIEYYFAEFLSLLEYPDLERRRLEITNDVWINDPKKLIEGKLQIGKNVYFLGTANNDESTFAISDKVYDRAMILNLDKKATPFKGTPTKSKIISNTELNDLALKAIDGFKDRKESIDLDKWILFIGEQLNEKFAINFGNRMVNQIKAYVPVYIECGGKAIEAFDDFVSKKILRKLESKDFLRLGKAVASFIDALDEHFGKDNLSLCKEYLSKFIVN